MRSARQQSEIDSRSALTYSRNTGMNVLITAAQKLSALWMKTAAAGVAGVLLLCPPSFSDKIAIIGDLARQLFPPLTSAHNNWSA